MSRYNSSPEYRTTDQCIENGLTLLASIDESASYYEVDENAIFRKPDGKYLLRQASGCSCWDGDWNEHEFDSLDEVEEYLTSSHASNYSPSLKGAEQLMAEARKHDRKSCVELQCN